MRKINVNLNVDHKNKAMIMTGKIQGKDIVRAVVVCRDGDEFDYEFGEKLVQKKFIIRYNTKIRKINDNRIKSIKKDITKLQTELIQLTKDNKEIDNELAYLIEDMNIFIMSKYND